MATDYAYDPSTMLIMQLAPITIIQAFYAIVTFQLSVKQKWNAWLWTIVTLIPLIGMIAFIVLFFSSHMRTLDRLSELEKRTPQ